MKFPIVRSFSLVLASNAYGQTALYTFVEDSKYDQFGTAVSAAGDVNADGFADGIVGAPADDNNGTQSGSARVLSGRDGSVLYTLNGSTAHTAYGLRLVG